MQDCLGPLLTYKASAELNRYNELLHPDKSEDSDIVKATEGRGSEVVPETRLLISISPTAVISFDGPNCDLQAVKHDLDRKALSRYQQLSQRTNAIAINAAIPTLNEAISRSYGTGILTGEPVVAVPKALRRCQLVSDRLATNPSPPTRSCVNQSGVSRDYADILRVC